jgi:ADP-ribose pyrophosphatase
VTSVIKLKELHEQNLDEKFVASEEVFHGRLLKVRRDKVVLPNGVETTRELIRHPGAVAIVPVLEDGSIVFVKQYRYPVGTVLYELPAGKLEPGEDPDACAPRELSEETGYDAARLEYLTSIVTTPGFTDEVIHLYKATGLTLHSQHHGRGRIYQRGAADAGTSTPINPGPQYLRQQNFSRAGLLSPGRPPITSLAVTRPRSEKVTSNQEAAC